MSANDGFAPAALLVGNAYLKGIGVKRNLREAIYYYEIAAKGGNKEAIKILQAIKKQLQKQQKANLAYVTVRSNVYNDKVYVDGKYVGHTKVTVPVRAGVKHEIVVAKDGYTSYKTTVNLKPKENKTIKAVLKKR
jgi:TPR repeat protein